MECFKRFCIETVKKQIQFEIFLILKVLRSNIFYNKLFRLF